MAKKTKDRITTYTIDPYQGAAAMLVGATPVGMRLKDLKRKGTKATVSYIKEEGAT